MTELTKHIGGGELAPLTPMEVDQFKIDCEARRKKLFEARRLKLEEAEWELEDLRTRHAPERLIRQKEQRVEAIKNALRVISKPVV